MYVSTSVRETKKAACTAQQKQQDCKPSETYVLCTHIQDTNGKQACKMGSKHTHPRLDSQSHTQQLTTKNSALGR